MLASLFTYREEVPRKKDACKPTHPLSSQSSRSLRPQASLLAAYLEEVPRKKKDACKLDSTGAYVAVMAHCLQQLGLPVARAVAAGDGSGRHSYSYLSAFLSSRVRRRAIVACLL